MEQTMEESEGKQTVRGSKAPSETGTIKGLDVQEPDNGSKGMDKGELEAMPSAPLPVRLKEVAPKKDDTQHWRANLSIQVTPCI